MWLLPEFVYIHMYITWAVPFHSQAFPKQKGELNTMTEEKKKNN